MGEKEYMNTRKMLNKIREIQHREMLNKRDGGTPLVKPILFEQEDERVQEIDDDSKKEEEQKFREVVSDMTEFGHFKVMKENVQWSGRLIREEIDWIFTLSDTSGIFITANMLQVRETTLQTLTKLRAYYETWASEWADRIGEYYRPEEGEDVEGETPETPEEGGDEGLV